MRGREVKVSVLEIRGSQSREILTDANLFLEALQRGLSAYQQSPHTQQPPQLVIETSHFDNQVCLEFSLVGTTIDVDPPLLA